jgi:predicted TIM-barrel fold metal-dependent hydrolase
MTPPARRRRTYASTRVRPFSTDYPFHRPGAAAIEQFFDAIPDPSDRSKIASGNAKALFRLP